MAEENIQILKLNLEADGNQSVSELLQLIEQLRTKLSGLRDGTSDYASVVNDLKTINRELGSSFLKMGEDMAKASEDVKKLVDALNGVVGVYQSLGNVDLDPEVVEQLTEISDAITTLSEIGAIDELSDDIVDFSSNVDMTNLTVGELVEKITKLTDSLVETDTVTDKTVQQVVELIDAYRELGQRAEDTDEVIQGNVRSYKELTLEMRELKKIWRETNDEAERTRVGARILELNNELKALDATIGNYQRNVGNYSSAMTDFSKVILTNLGQINPSLGKIGLQIRSLIPLIKSATKTATVGLSGIKAALASTGIGLLVIALGQLIANFDKLKTKVMDSIPYFKRMKDELQGIKDNADKLAEDVAKGYNEAQEDITQKMAIESAKRSAIGEEEKNQQKKALQDELALQEKLRKEQQKAYDEQSNRLEELQGQLDELEQKKKNIGFVGNILPESLFKGVSRRLISDQIEKVKAEMEGVTQVSEVYNKNLEESAKRIGDIHKKIEVLNNRPLKDTYDTLIDINDQLKSKSNIDELINNFNSKYKNLVSGYLTETQQLFYANKEYINELGSDLDRINSEIKRYGEEFNDVYEYNSSILKNEINISKALLEQQRKEIENDEKIKSVTEQIQLIELNRPKDTSKYIDEQIESYKRLLELYKKSLSEQEAFSGILLNPFEDIKEIANNLDVDLSEVLAKISKDFEVSLTDEGTSESISAALNEFVLNAFKDGVKVDLSEYFGEGITEYLIPQGDLTELRTRVKTAENIIEDLVYKRKTLNIERPLKEIENEIQENLLDNFNKFNDGYKEMLDNRIDAQKEYIKQLIEIGAAPDETQEQFAERLREQYIKLKEFMKEQQSWIDENRNYWVKYSLSIADAFGNMLGSIADDWYDMIQVQLKAGEISQEEYERQFERMKGLQIAEATIQMITGAIGAFMQASLAYPPPYGQILGGITAAAVTASGLAEIAKIRRTTMDNTNRAGFGTTAPTIANPVIQEYTPNYAQNVTGRDEITNLTNALSEQPLRAFVVESDITSAQTIARKREEEATF